MNKDQIYTVIAVSFNTNSFGLKSIVLLSDDGTQALSILKSPYAGDKLPSPGDDVTLNQLGTYECPRHLPAVDPQTALKIIRTYKKKARVTA